MVPVPSQSASLTAPPTPVGHNSIGHKYIGHKCIGHNYIDDNYIVPSQSACSTALPTPVCRRVGIRTQVMWPGICVDIRVDMSISLCVHTYACVQICV